MKQFNVPHIYRSSLISAIKQQRKQLDKLKKDFTPTLLDLGPVQIYLARHFGFCYCGKPASGIGESGAAASVVPRRNQSQPARGMAQDSGRIR